MHTLKALVVDDEPLARERLARLLAEAGCEVVRELNNGSELLAWLKAPEQADVVFLDIQMPGLNGFEVLAELRQTLPVVFVSAFAEYAVRAFDTVAVDYLLKPVYEDRLARCLAKLEGHLVRPLTTEQIQAVAIQPTRFPIRAGDGEIFMDLEHISHFDVVGQQVWACRGPNRYPTRWRSLTEVEQFFPLERLLRIRRNLLLRPGKVLGWRPISLGRIGVTVARHVELVVSRAMSPRTKETLRAYGKTDNSAN
jgi:two-component system LytT family response regulator/two-component system response regulator AlgR